MRRVTHSTLNLLQDSKAKSLNNTPELVLSVRDLIVRTVSRSHPKIILDSVGLDVYRGETLCIIGESGSGKSVTAFSIMRLLPRDALEMTGGRIELNGKDISQCSHKEILSLRGTAMSMVFQEPMTALNPVQKVGEQIDEIVRIHRAMQPDARKALVLRMLGEVELPDPARVYQSYPHELSGGQRQRIVIAIALILEPTLLIADEPTTALDVTVQKQILYLMKRLQKDRGTSIIFITHDFGVVAEIADRILVMRNGKIVESGTRDQILTKPSDQYTRELILSVPEAQPPARHASKTNTIMEIRNLGKTYSKKSWFGASVSEVPALRDIVLDIRKDEVVGVVGESGSGKSTLARCIIGLVGATSGEVRLNGELLPPLSRDRSRALKKRMQIVFQDPYRSLDPRHMIITSLMEGPRSFGIKRESALERIHQLLTIVGLDSDVLYRYPHQFSGGQRQRICLARAIALEPDILIADEAVSALDVTVQAQVLQLLADIKARTGVAIIFITHDLRVAAQISDKIIVMQKGQIVEQGSPQGVILSPQQAYTRKLIESAPGKNWDFKNFKPLNHYEATVISDDHQAGRF